MRGGAQLQHVFRLGERTPVLRCLRITFVGHLHAPGPGAHHIARLRITAPLPPGPKPDLGPSSSCRPAGPGQEPAALRQAPGLGLAAGPGCEPCGAAAHPPARTPDAAAGAGPTSESVPKKAQRAPSPPPPPPPPPPLTAGSAAGLLPTRERRGCSRQGSSAPVQPARLLPNTPKGLQSAPPDLVERSLLSVALARTRAEPPSADQGRRSSRLRPALSGEGASPSALTAVRLSPLSERAGRSRMGGVRLDDGMPGGSRSSWPHVLRCGAPLLPLHAVFG